EAATTPKPDAEYEAEIAAMLAEMRQMDEQSRDTWDEIDRPKAESKTIRTSSDAIPAQTDWRLGATAQTLAEPGQARKLARLPHENLLLRLETSLLGIERSLPPATPAANPVAE